MIRSGVSIERDTVDEVVLAVRNLTRRELLVGVPEEKADRTGDGSVTNAAIGYWHEFGVPSRNIPARPHLIPGVRDAADEIARAMARGAMDVLLRGDPRAGDRALNSAGLIAVSSVKKKIQEGLQPPLKMGAIRARWNRQKKRRGKTIPIDFVAEAKPLINTGAYLRSITYVLQDTD